jgi:NTE family protein
VDTNEGTQSRQDALVLQAGGALGAYQVGVYEELSKAGFEPQWIAGASVGAINAALIAGNPPDRRMARLTEFWHMVSSSTGPFRAFFPDAMDFKRPRGVFDEFGALWSALTGIPGFYKPRFPPPMLQPDGTRGALSLFDLAPLHATLEELVDFDLINSKKVRLSVCAANVRTGESAYFDNHEQAIRPEHIVASGALPPMFPPIKIDGEEYWDGGLVSDSPLHYVLDRRDKSLVARPLRVVHVDLYSGPGEMPVNLSTAQQRRKDVLYSNRTRYTRDWADRDADVSKKISDLLRKLPAEAQDHSAMRELVELTRAMPVDVFHFIYRQAAGQPESTEFEFLRKSVLRHWQSGRDDAKRASAHPDWTHAPVEGFRQFDATPFDQQSKDTQ